MIESLSFMATLTLSITLWFLSSLVPILYPNKGIFWSVVPLIIFRAFLERPLTNYLKELDQLSNEPAWLINILQFLRDHPIIIGLLILILFPILAFIYDRKNQIHNVLVLLLGLILSILFPLTLSGLISNRSGMMIACVLAVELILIAIVKSKNKPLSAQ